MFQLSKMNLSQCEVYLQQFTALQDSSLLFLRWELFSQILFTTLGKGVFSYSRYVKSHSFCLLLKLSCSFICTFTLGTAIELKLYDNNSTLQNTKSHAQTTRSPCASYKKLTCCVAKQESGTKMRTVIFKQFFGAFYNRKSGQVVSLV